MDLNWSREINTSTATKVSSFWKQTLSRCAGRISPWESIYRSFHSWTCLFSYHKCWKFLLGVGIFISWVKSRCVSKIHALHIWIHLISMFYIPSLSFRRWSLIYCHCLQREEKWTLNFTNMLAALCSPLHLACKGLYSGQLLFEPCHV